MDPTEKEIVQQATVAAEASSSTNSMLEDLVSAGNFGSVYNPLPPGEYAPNRPGGGSVPLGGSAVQGLTNFNGNKFTRGWLSGAGGAQVDQALGSLAQIVKPAPYNNQLLADLMSVVPEYGAPVAGVANQDLNSSGRRGAAENLYLANAEFIPSTFDSRLNGLDTVTGQVLPRVFTADNRILAAPEAPFNQQAQVADFTPALIGVDDVPFGSRPAAANIWRGGGGRIRPRPSAV